MRPIDTDPLIYQIKLQANRTSLGEISNPYMTWQDVVRLILEAPAITYKDLVPHGRWQPFKKDGVVVCSVCGNVETQTSYFCRCCGTKMDGVNSIERGVE